MRRILSFLNRYFETVPNRLSKRRRLIWMFFVLMSVFLSWGISRTQFDMTIEGWFAEDDPAKLLLDQFREQFGSDDGIFIVYKPKDGDVFSKKSLEAVRGIREELLNFRLKLKEGETSMLEHVTRVNSIVNAGVLTTEGATLVSKKLVGRNIPDTAEVSERIRRIALTQKGFPLLYFSKDYRYGGLQIETDLGAIFEESGTIGDELAEDEFEEDEDDVEMTVDEGAAVEKVKFKSTEMTEYLDLMAAVRKIIGQPKYADHLEYYPIGNAPLMEFGQEIMAEMGPMYSGMLTIIVVMLFLLFRSFSAVLWPITIVVLSSAWIVGIAGWAGITISTMLMLSVMLILTVGTADTIHILSGYLYFRKRGQDHPEAMRLSYRKSGLACGLTTVTTMVGMLALTFTPISHIETFGYMSAAGVGLAFLFTIFWLPVMMDLWAPVSKKAVFAETETDPAASREKGLDRLLPGVAKYLQRLLDKVLPFVEKSPRTIILAFAAIFGFCIYGQPKSRWIPISSGSSKREPQFEKPMKSSTSI